MKAPTFTGPKIFFLEATTSRPFANLDRSFMLSPEGVQYECVCECVCKAAMQFHLPQTKFLPCLPLRFACGLRSLPGESTAIKSSMAFWYQSCIGRAWKLPKNMSPFQLFIVCPCCRWTFSVLKLSFNGLWPLVYLNNLTLQ